MSKMAIDTNILVYAHNGDNPYHYKAKDFLVNQLQNYPNNICIPYQCLIEFISTVTKRIENPFSIEQALQIVAYYKDFGIDIIYPKPTQLSTFLEIYKQTPYKNRLFDVAICATLKDNGIHGIYTVNTKDFQDYPFLTVINPLL